KDACYWLHNTHVRVQKRHQLLPCPQADDQASAVASILTLNVSSFYAKHRCDPSYHHRSAAQTLKAAMGRCRPLSVSSPAGSVAAKDSTAVCTLWSIKIWPSWA